MTWSQEISQLITDVDQLTSAANVKKSALDALVASTETDKNGAAASIVAATASFASASTRSQEAEAHKNTALAIYGSNVAQQTAVASVQASAALASGYAASASAALQQDLSGVAGALHRSPNAVTSMFIYDTSKDSDGGAWTEKCQHTSWYNETIYGKWLGQQPTEFYARNANATVSAPIATYTLTTATFTLYGNNTLVDNGDGTLTITCLGGTNSTLGAFFPVSALSSVFTPNVLKTYAISFAKITNPSNRSFQVGSTGNSGYTDRVFTSENIYSPLVSNSILRFSNLQIGDKITFSKTFTISEITAINTQSGDYFQLTTDGKFYRLLKNLINRSSTFASFGNSGAAAALTLASGQGPSGGTAYKLVPAASAATLGHTGSSWFGVAVPGMRYTFSIRAKAGEYPRIGVRGMYNATTGYMFHGTIDLTNGTAVTNTGLYPVTATPDPRGNGYYIIKVEGLIANLTTGLDATIEAHNATSTAQQNFAADGTSGIFVTEPQYEIGTIATAYEENINTGTFSEVFRGNKRDFPRLAGIVTEATNITIYDLTEPGRPMWIRFFTNGLAENRIIHQVSSIPSIAAMQGRIAFCGSADQGGLTTINFALDSAQRVTNSTAWTGDFKGNIANRNNTLGWQFFTGAPTINAPIGIAVAMTVLPDAPIDPITNLKVPTIAISTSSGVSVIKHNGTVVVVGSAGGVQGDLGFLADGRLFISPISGTTAWYAYLISKDFATANRYSFYASDGATEPVLTNAPGTEAVTAAAISPSAFLTGTVAGSMAISKPNSTRARGLVTRIKSNYNTGWLSGDARRAYLSDIDVGAVTGTELITNGTFDTDISGWTSSRSAVLSYDNGSIRVTSGGTIYGKANQIITTVVGQLYTISFTAIPGTATCALTVGTTLDGYDLLDQRNPTSPGTRAYIFRATTTTAYVGLQNDSAIAGVYCSFDDVSVRAGVYDRSYKAKGIPVFGTLTKAQLASGTSLVGYSGWSTANYLRETYSADLDFGTGEWSAGAWINTKAPEANLLLNSNTSTNRFFQNCNVTDNAVLAPDGTMTAMLVRRINNTTLSRFIDSYAYGGNLNQTLAVSFYAKPADTNPATYLGFSWMLNGIATQKVFLNTFTPSTLTGNGTLIVEPAANGYSRFKFTGIKSNQYRWLDVGIDGYISGGVNFNEGTSDTGIHLWGYQVELDEVSTYKPTTTSAIANVSPILSRTHSTGPSITLGIDAIGLLTATAFDGTTTRTITTTAPYNTLQWQKVEANYTTDGSLTIRVNGRDVGVTRGNPLLTLTNTSAVLTVGNSYSLNAPLRGSIALLKLGATVPTPEQSVFMYEQEKHLFRTNAVSVLPDANGILDMSYDDATDRWATISTANESYWDGLVRTSVTPVPGGSYSKISTTSGVELSARITTNPGVDVTIPAYVLREELVKRSESANKLNRQITIYDYIGGFTGNITTGSTSILLVANLTYPVSPVGARISGTGIPANTTITGVSGTTIYISAAATATTTGLSITFLDFKLPVGFETESVTSAGVVKQEGATKDYTRLYDGFLETIRFAVAPGVTTWVRVQATKSIQ